MATKIVKQAEEETQAGETPLEASPAVFQYRLVRSYWDNSTLHPKGTILPFEEGKQPKFAVKIEEQAQEISADGTGADDAEAEK